MGITRSVRLGVMLDVSRCPRKRRALEGHGTEYEQEAFDHGVGLKTAMRQHAVEANGHPKANEDVHHCQQDQIGPVNRSLPEHPDSQQCGEERNNNKDQHDISIGCDGSPSASALSSSAFKSRTLMRAFQAPNCFILSVLCRECFRDGAAIHAYFSLFPRATGSHAERYHASLPTDEESLGSFFSYTILYRPV